MEQRLRAVAMKRSRGRYFFGACPFGEAWKDLRAFCVLMAAHRGCSTDPSLRSG
jgi:hypothetical protein